MLIEFDTDEYEDLETHLTYRQIIESNTEEASWPLESVEAFWRELGAYRHGVRNVDQLALAESRPVLSSFLKKHLRHAELDLLRLRFGAETGEMIPVSKAIKKFEVTRSAYDKIFRRLRHPIRFSEIRSVLKTVFPGGEYEDVESPA